MSAVLSSAAASRSPSPPDVEYVSGATSALLPWFIPVKHTSVMCQSSRGVGCEV